MLTQEIQENIFSRSKFYGLYYGIVEYNQDPLMLGRVKVRVHHIYGSDKELPVEGLPWSVNNAGFYGGIYDKGSFIVPEVGSAVTVSFVDGNALYPFVMGSFYSMPDHETEVMDEKTKKKRAKYNELTQEVHQTPDKFERTRVSEAPIETQSMIDDKPTIRVYHKTDDSEFWEEKKRYFQKTMLEHFPTSKGLEFHDKFDNKIQETNLGDDSRYIRILEGDYKGIFSKNLDVFFDVMDNTDEIKITLFNKKMFVYIDKKTGEIRLYFDKLVIMNDVEIMGNIKLMGELKN